MTAVWPPHARGHDGRTWVLVPPQASHGYLGAFQRCPPGAIPRRDPMLSSGFDQPVVRQRCLSIDRRTFDYSEEDRAESSRPLSVAPHDEDGGAGRYSKRSGSNWDKCKHRATSSLASASTSNDAVETTPRKADNAADSRQPWSVQQTFRLGVVGEEESFLGRAKLLDTNVVFSVQTAIDRLNRGTIPCDEESCIVFSASSQAYFLLYRYGSREKAISQLNLSEEAFDTSDSSSHPELHESMSEEVPVHDPPMRSSKTSASASSPQVDPPSKDRDSRQSSSQAPPQRPASKATANHQESDTAPPSARDHNRRRRFSPPRSKKGGERQGGDENRPRLGDRRDQRNNERSGVLTASPPVPATVGKGDLFEDGEKLLADAKALLECADRTIKTFKEPPFTASEENPNVINGEANEGKPSEDVHPEESTDDRGSTAGSAGSSSAPGISASTSGYPGGDANLSSRSNGGKGGRQKKGSGLGTPLASSRKVPQPKSPPTVPRTVQSTCSETGSANTSTLGLATLASATASQVAVHDAEQVSKETGNKASEKPPASGEAVAAPSSPAPPKDGTGKDIQVGNRVFHLLKVIGRGAFGVVWHARERRREEPNSSESLDSDLVAVKAVFANNAKAFTTAVFEAELLQMFSAKLPASSWDRVPRYIAHSVIPRKATANGEAQGNGGSVRLAMSFVRGCSLDQWLYGISDEEHKQVEVSKLVQGRLPGGRQQSMRLRRACTFVRSLVSQLAGVFAVLQSLAFHRDVSSHNVLIDIEDGEAARPKFALIDFGLAVKSGSWHQEWSSSNLAGDPRYWTPPSWMAFAFGFRYVETHPNKGFHRQYLTRIDHFGLGVLAFEVLFALWDSELAEEDGAKPLLAVRAAWCTFWDAVIRLFQMFHRQGSSAVRQHLARSPDEGVSRVAGHLRLLRQVLRQATAEMADPSLTPLFNLLIDLVDERGVATWDQIPGLLREDVRQESREPADKMLLISPRRFEAVRRDSTFSMSPLRSREAVGNPTVAANAKQVLKIASVDKLSCTLPHYNRSSRFARHRDGSLEPEPRRGNAAVTPGVFLASTSERDQLDRTLTGVSLAREIQNSELWRYAPPSGQGLPLVNLSGPQKDELDRSVQMLSSTVPRQQAAPYVRPVVPLMDRNAHSYVPPPNLLARGPSYTPTVQASSSYVPMPVQSRSYVPPPGSVKFPNSQQLTQPSHNPQLRASMPTLSPPVPSPPASLLAATSPVACQMNTGNLQILAGIKQPDRSVVSAGASTASTATVSGLGTPGGTSTPVTVNSRGGRAP